MDSEKQWLKKLDLDSWRNLSKEKFMSVVTALPEMSDKVRLEVIKQVPNFIKLCSEGLNNAKESFMSVVKSNDENTNLAIEKIDLIRQDLVKELNKPFVFGKRRKELQDKLLELPDAYERLNDNNKEFLKDIYGKWIKGICAILGLVVVFVGGKIIISGGDD